MKEKSLVRWLSRLAVAALLIANTASAAEVHVMISAGFYKVYSELGPAFERASGHRLVMIRLKLNVRTSQSDGRLVILFKAAISKNIITGKRRLSSTSEGKES